ncbi:aminomethyl transferase family protein [Halobellus sp. GM3]|uniref:aminomethyl transferase family protein n=1 Tax=Halobellus sp. GM3 TaxID=3458410 RepID=UPI00403DC51B
MSESPIGTGGESYVERMRAEPGYIHPGWRQREFTNWIDEQIAWKETCYIGDWSFISDLEVSGPEAIDLLADLSVNSFENFAVGQGKHIVQCNEDGKVLAEGVVRRTGEETFILHSTPSYWTEFNLQRGDYDATCRELDLFKFQVQGPNSLQVLEAVADGSLRDIEFIHFGPIDISGREVTAFRMGMAGELGFELQGPQEYADEIWDHIVDAGSEYGLRRLGGRTASINHLEACFPPRGRVFIPAIVAPEMAAYQRWLLEDMDRVSRDILTYPIEGSFDADDISAWFRSPVELGWENRIAFDHDFLGREALEAEVENPRRTLVTLVWDDADVVDVYASLFRDGEPYKFMDMPNKQQWKMESDRVLVDAETVGVSTFRGYSYYFREMLSLCTIDVAHAEPGTAVTVVWGEPDGPQKEIDATVAPAPYKPDRRFGDLTSV